MKCQGVLLTATDAVQTVGPRDATRRFFTARRNTKQEVMVQTAPW